MRNLSGMLGNVEEEEPDESMTVALVALAGCCS